MTPLLLGNIASAAIGALTGSSDSKSTSGKDPFDDLVAKLQQTASAEKTVTKSDGSSVTTVPTANGGQRVVSETSASGQTLTESGYVSPALLQKFLDNLFTTLKADGAAVGGTTASAATSAGSTAASSISGAVDKLGTQLTAGTGSTANLVNSFGSLLQSSGIDLPAGGSASSALKSFLAHAAPAIQSGEITRTGINLRA
jgi:hypothetical protein